MNQFTLQIATNVEQSGRMIALGINPETADFFIRQITETDDWSNSNTNYSLFEPWMNKEDIIKSMFMPAWSLSRLIEMLPNKIPESGFKPHHPELIKHESGYNLSIRRCTADCLVGTHIENDPIECCVSMIDWLIKNHHFDKEYLK